jgi:hypothetical protein
MKMILDFLAARIDSKTKSTAAFSFILSTLLAVVLFCIASISAGTIDSQGTQITFGNIGIWGAAALSVVYIFMFVGIWFITDSRETENADDIYSVIRKSLVGAWSVTYHVNDGEVERNRVPVPDPIVACEIYINAIDRKLEMKFDIFKNPIWADGFNL